MRLRYAFLYISLAAILLVAIVAIVTQPFVTQQRSDSPPVSPDRLRAHVRHLSVDLYPRSFDRFRNIRLAADYVEREFREAGADVSVQEFPVQEASYRNVIARFGPADGPLLVIGAHYDSHGDAGAGAENPKGFGPESHTPGADDNASGVAGLIELARLLGRNPPPRPIELVAYTLEEPPHFRTDDMGSVRHARALAASGRKVELMLSLEMIGYFSDEPGSQDYPVPGMRLLYPAEGNFVALVGLVGDFGAIRRAKSLMSGASDLPVRSINAPAMIQGVDFSDHRSYWAEEIPALMITDTAFYRNTSYHEAGDTFDRLDYSRMAKVVQAVHALAQRY